MDIFTISQCNISQTIGEANRFIFHIFLVHICTAIVDGKSDLFGEEFFKILIITIMAIILYHLFFRKIVEPIIEKMKLICYDQKKIKLKKNKHNKYNK
jgi:putative effector of murein hydrolase LrgA (UPF0299 family)